MPRQEKISVCLSVTFLFLVAIGFLFSPILSFVFNPFDKVKAIISFLRTGIYAVLVILPIGYVIVLGVRRTLKHVMEITDISIVILEGNYSFPRPKKYATVHVKNLRGSTYPGRKEGAIKFDYGSHTIVFGKSLDEAEANLIAQAIIKKFPSLKDPQS